MAVGRTRKQNKDLPRRVYRKHGAYYFVDAHQKWHRLGKTKAEMHRALAELLEPPADSLAHYLDRYEREELPKKASSTQGTQARQLKTLRAVYGHMTVSTVRTSDVAAFLDQYPSPIQANRHIALLSHVYTKLIRWGVVEKNPCTGVQRNQESPRTRYISDGEFWAVWVDMPRHMQLLMELALCTGQRQGDLLRLRWSEVGSDSIRFIQGKTGKVLDVGISPHLAAVLARCRGGVAGVYVIRKPNGQPYTASGIQTTWQRFMRAYDGERFTFHDIRAKSGSDHPDGEHLGHDVSQTLKRIYRRKPKAVSGL